MLAELQALFRMELRALSGKQTERLLRPHMSSHGIGGKQCATIPALNGSFAFGHRAASFSLAGYRPSGQPPSRRSKLTTTTSTRARRAVAASVAFEGTTVATVRQCAEARDDERQQPPPQAQAGQKEAPAQTEGKADMPLNIRELAAIAAFIFGIGVAAIATERRSSELTLPAFTKPICPINTPLTRRTATDI